MYMYKKGIRPFLFLVCLLRGLISEGHHAQACRWRPAGRDAFRSWQGPPRASPPPITSTSQQGRRASRGVPRVMVAKIWEARKQASRCEPRRQPVAVKGWLVSRPGKRFSTRCSRSHPPRIIRKRKVVSKSRLDRSRLRVCFCTSSNAPSPGSMCMTSNVHVDALPLLLLATAPLGGCLSTREPRSKSLGADAVSG